MTKIKQSKAKCLEKKNQNSTIQIHKPKEEIPTSEVARINDCARQNVVADFCALLEQHHAQISVAFLAVRFAKNQAKKKNMFLKRKLASTPIGARREPDQSCLILMAAQRPAGPPPTITTSVSSASRSAVSAECRRRIFKSVGRRGGGGGGERTFLSVGRELDLGVVVRGERAARRGDERGAAARRSKQALRRAAGGA